MLQYFLVTETCLNMLRTLVETYGSFEVQKHLCTDISEIAHATLLGQHDQEQRKFFWHCPKELLPTLLSGHLIVPNTTWPPASISLRDLQTAMHGCGEFVFNPDGFWENVLSLSEG